MSLLYCKRSVMMFFMTVLLRSRVTVWQASRRKLGNWRCAQLYQQHVPAAA